MKLNYSTTSHRKRPQKKRSSRQRSRRSWDFHGHIPLSAFPLLLFTFLLAVGILFDIDLTPLLPTESAVSPEGLEEAPFRMTVLDVGQGLSVFIEADGQTMLYDGGDRNASSFVVSYLEQEDLEKLNYVTISHYDADHLNGIVGVLNHFPVEQVLAPDYSAKSAIFKSYQKVLAEKSLTPIHPAVGDTFELGQASFTVLGPTVIVPDSGNNNSLAIRITYGNTSFLLTGDAEHEEEEDICQSWGRFLLSDVYVAGHHGSGSSTSWSLLENAIPEYTIISCGKGNSYGHPHDTVMERLESMEIPVYRTDIQGTISVASDGENLIWSQEPCNDYTPGD